MYVVFSVENKSALSDEGKVLDSLLKTTSAPAKERMKSFNSLPGSCWCKFSSFNAVSV